MAKKENAAILAEDAFNAAEEEAKESTSVYTHKFAEPFNYDGNSYEELTFDWGKLTGKDGLAIENELMSLGKPAIIASMSGEYLIRMAARACDKQIGADAFEQMRLSDYNKIRSSARSFLLRSEL